MLEKYIAMCGLDCASCAAFVATKNNDDTLRKKTAEEWTARRAVNNKPPIKPEDINCFGCFAKDKPIYQNCSVCEIRKCGLSKGITNCDKCENYKCERLIEEQKHFF